MIRFSLDAGADPHRRLLLCSAWVARAPRAQLRDRKWANLFPEERGAPQRQGRAPVVKRQGRDPISQPVAQVSDFLHKGTNQLQREARLDLSWYSCALCARILLPVDG